MLQWSERYDLHGHSTHSDGELSVSKLAQRIKDEGVEVWALTDHDVISGWKEASEEARLRGMRFIPGVEITCIPGLPAEKTILEKEGRDSKEAFHVGCHLRFGAFASPVFTSQALLVVDSVRFPFRCSSTRELPCDFL